MPVDGRETAGVKGRVPKDPDGKLNAKKRLATVSTLVVKVSLRMDLRAARDAASQAF